MYQVIKGGKILSSATSPEAFRNGGYDGSTRTDCLFLSTSYHKCQEFVDANGGHKADSPAPAPGQTAPAPRTARQRTPKKTA